MPRLSAISGVGIKGPACFLLEIGGRRLMLDLGRGPDGDRLPDLSAAGRIDAILFSHAHADHTGGLVLWQALGRPPLYATRPTIALAPQEAMRDALALEDRDEILGIPVQTGPAGHAPGAVWMRLGGPGGLVYTGDISGESTLFRHSLPPPARALVFDASYATEPRMLDQQIDEILAATGPDTLFPCPAGGRGLEMALQFRARGLDIALCPLHRQVANLLLAHEGWLVPGGARALRELLAQARPLEAESPPLGIMIAAGPNAERGVSAALARRMVDAGRGRIVFTGHVARGTPAEALVASGRACFMRWNVHPAFAEQREIVATVAPEIALAAFCDAAALPALRATTGWPLAGGTEMAW